MPAFKQVDDTIRPLASRNLAVAHKAMAAVTGKKVSELLNCAESTISDFKEEQLERAMQVIAAVGLKLVPKTEQTLPAAEIAAYKLLARKAMDQEEPTTAWGNL